MPNMSAPFKLKVFLCHSSGDKKAVRALYHRLRTESWIDPWLDEEKLLPGQPWRDEIEKAVEQSHLILVCLSPASIDKEGYVQREIKIALDQVDYMPEGRIFIIPLKLVACDIPRRLREWQWVNYYEAGAHERLIKSLELRAEQVGTETAPQHEQEINKAQPSLNKQKSTPVLKAKSNLFRKPLNWVVGGSLLVVLALSILLAFKLIPGTDYTAFKLLNTLTGHSSIVTSVAFSPDGKTLASGSWDKTIKLWDTNSGKLLNTLTGHIDIVDSVVFSPDGKTLASGSHDKAIKLWDTASGKFFAQPSGALNLDNIYIPAAFSPNGKLLASAKGNTIKLWDASSGNLLNTITGQYDSVHSVMFNPDGKLLALGSRDKTIGLWDAESGKLLITLTGILDNSYITVAFSPDGKTLACESGGHSIKLWDIATVKELLTLTGHSDYVGDIVFSPDSKTLASGSTDRTIKLWNSSSGKLLNSLIGDFGGGLAFSPDGKTLASGSVDGTIKLWGMQ